MCGKTHTHTHTHTQKEPFYFLYLLSSFSIEMGVVVDDPGAISNVYQVILTEHIADILSTIFIKNKILLKTTSAEYKSR